MQINQQPATNDAIRQSIKSASLKTGVDFGFLLNTAMRESSLQAGAKSSDSSATGLFQFIESTWLETLKRDGPEHGLDRYAKKISKLPNGKYVVDDPVIRDEILNLRSDPEIASIMAGALTARNSGLLREALGRDASQGELYIAHFLGANGSLQLINAATHTPDRPAIELFPRQAVANQSIFYDEKQQPRSVREIYQELISRHTGNAETGGISGATIVNTIQAGSGTRVPVVMPSFFGKMPNGGNQVSSSHFQVGGRSLFSDVKTSDRSTLFDPRRSEKTNQMPAPQPRSLGGGGQINLSAFVTLTQSIENSR